MKNIKPIPFTLPKAQYRATGLPLCLLWVFCMDKKRCTDCGNVKSLNDFYKNKNFKDGLQYYCKECEIKRKLDYYNSKNGLITIIYLNQKGKSKKRGYALPSYTKMELVKWWFSQHLFHELYTNWINSGYKKGLKPSIDRKDDYKSYTFDNITLTTWDENNKKGHRDRKNGVNNKDSKAVLQYDKQGNFIKEYYSISQASRDTFTDKSHIGHVCRGEMKTSGGFIWKYKNAQ